MCADRGVVKLDFLWSQNFEEVVRMRDIIKVVGLAHRILSPPPYTTFIRV